MKTFPKLRRAATGSQGMALLLTLLLISLSMIVLIAYLLMTKTELRTSYAFSQSVRSELLAQGALMRLVAQHASAAAPYASDPATGGPTDATRTAFFSDTPNPAIFSIQPLPGLDTSKDLVTLSRSTPAEPAYSPRRWAYAGINDSFFFPRDNSLNPVAPDWVNYFAPDPDGGPDLLIGQIAYAVWNDSGKYDVNMVGRDQSNNGLAPHNLLLENLTTDPTKLLKYLNGADPDLPPLGSRDRTNFSLRRISTSPLLNNTGNDRFFFTVEEMMLRPEIFTPAQLLRFTPFSRDFEVRADWDGNRSSASQFLKAYVNNPNFNTAFNRAMGNDAVAGNLGSAAINTAAGAIPGAAPIEARRELALLMGVLRQILPNPNNTYAKAPLPEYTSNATLPNALIPLAEPSGQPKKWFDPDIAAIALNLWQGSDRTQEGNGSGLTGVSSNWRALSWLPITMQAQWDPHRRVGTRAQPYINEVTVRVERVSINQIRITEYYEIWNPYAIDWRRKEISYWNWHELMWEYRTTSSPPGIVLNHGVTGNISPISGGGLVQWVAGPGPGGFSIGSFTSTLRDFPIGVDFQMQTRPAIGYRILMGSQARSYASGPSFDGPAVGTPGGGGRRAVYAIEYFIAAAKIDTVGEVAWQSFQVDDPRTLTLPSIMDRDTSTTRTTPAQFDADVSNPDMIYSFRRYPDSHTLFGITMGPKIVSPYGDGYNQNFGDNFPSSWNSLTLANRRIKALATFTLPGRPYSNLGEVGSIFLFRPWRTLNLADRPTPADPTQPVPASLENYPSRIFDFFTTVGTTNLAQNLPADDAARTQNQEFMLYTADGGDRRLRPIRGKINLNAASPQLLKAILERPYSVVNYVGSGIASPPASTADDPAANPNFIDMTIDSRDIDGVINDLLAARPLRSVGDLGRLASVNNSTVLRMYQGTNTGSGRLYPDHLINAMLARLAAFGTTRQQIYTIDVAARTFHPKNPDVVTAETRLEARVYFDTYSRQSFIQSVRLK